MPRACLGDAVLCLRWPRTMPRRRCAAADSAESGSAFARSPSKQGTHSWHRRSQAMIVATHQARLIPIEVEGRWSGRFVCRSEWYP